MFIKIGNELFDPENAKNVGQNLIRDEKKVLAEIEKYENDTVRVQDKGSQFVVLMMTMYIKLKIKLTTVLFYN